MVEIGLTVWPKTGGGAKAPPAPALRQACSYWVAGIQYCSLLICQAFRDRTIDQKWNVNFCNSMLLNYLKGSMKFFRRKCHYYWLFLQKKPLSSQLKNNKQILACEKNSWKHVMSSLIVYKLVSDKACDMWQEFTTKDILEILRVLNIMGQIQCNYCQASTLSMIRQIFWQLFR